MLPFSTLLLLASPACADGGAVELSYKSYRTWDIVLPAEQFARISGGFSKVHCKGESFAAALDGTALEVDTDGDGEMDVRVVGKEDDFGKKTGLVTLEGEGPDGKPFKYTARLVDEGDGWKFAASGAMVGELAGTRIQLVDQDNDGRYDGYGTDAMVVGSGKAATFLSKVVSVGGELYAIDVSQDGSRIEYAPYTGPAGVLDLRSGLEVEAKLMAAVVKSTDGRYSFELSRAKEGLRVPAGEYRLHSGQLGLGKARAFVRPGRMKTIDVAVGEPTVVQWGGPVKGEFRYHRNGAELVISPAEVSYFGRAGEEYRVWDPVGKSPEFTIKEVKLGTEIAKAMFPGSSWGRAFVPVAVSVPADAEISVSMKAVNWAFGECAGKPVQRAKSADPAGV